TFAGEQAQIKARELLGFRVMLNPLPATIEVRGVNLPRANKSLAVGTISLYDNPLTSIYQFSLVPQNP
ncbi:MAG: hypothetical protein KC910_36455, partial [Candidatus Eremiobacteraeota bacterium]|nr:hypothetical protein [Candidatus Eremiobacteraeota bacterium]